MKLKNLPFRFQLLLAFLTAAALPLILSVFFILQFLDGSLTRQTQREGQRQLEQLQSAFSQMYQDSLLMCRRFNSDGSLPQSLLDNKTIDDTQKDAYLSLYRAVQDMRSRIQISVYDAGGRLRFSSASFGSPASSLPRYWGLLRQIPDFDPKLVFSPVDPYLVPKTNVLLQAAYPLEQSHGARTGYLVLDFTRDSFDSLFGSHYSDQDMLILTDQFLTPIYCSQQEIAKEEQKALLSQASRPLAQPASRSVSRSAAALWRQEPNTGFYLFLQKSSPLTSGTLHTLQTTCLLLAIPCLGLCVPLSLLLSRSISHPVRILDAAMKQIRGGDLSVQICLNRKDELGRLGDSFNRMTRELGEQIEAQMQRQKDLNETRLRLYQTQLNPHFLYNTLDTIKWNARIHQNPEIPVLAENLAIILRRSITARPFITLREELETISSYVEIQKIRFSGSFLYETEVPDQLETCLIPKMILQPLVENAILHGLEGEKDGYICIFAVQEQKQLSISVTDNGRGISSDMADWINSPSPPLREGHLGLFNVIQILKLDYGQKYGLHAEAAPDRGTTVTITLPLERSRLYV